jgi:hypothetical protein
MPALIVVFLILLVVMTVRLIKRNKTKNPESFDGLHRRIESLLALIQLLFLFQIAFGFIGPGYCFESSASAILPRIREDELRKVVEAWHQHTVQTASTWCTVTGLVGFFLSLLLGHSFRGYVKKMQG